MVRVCALAVNLAVIATVVALIRYSDQPQVRHEDCTYELVYGRQGPAGVVVMGTSRTGRGVQAATIEEQVAVVADIDPTTVVLFRAGNGMDDVPELVQDVSSNLGVNTILAVEYSIRASPEYQSVGRNFAVKNTTGELLDHLSSSNEPIDGLVRDVLGGFATKLTLAVNQVVLGETVAAWEGERPPTTTAQAVDLCSRIEGEARPRPNALVDLEGRVARRWGDWRGKPFRNWNLERVDYERLDHLTRATISDAAEAGIPVVFFRVPAYLEAPVDPAFADEFRARYGAELLIPPVELLEQLYVREFYQNVGHVGPEGREIFSTWLGEAIARVLVEDS